MELKLALFMYDVATKLKDLDLSWNQLNSTIPESWSSLTALTSLDVYANALQVCYFGKLRLISRRRTIN